MRENRNKAYNITERIDTGMSFAVLANADRLTKHKHAWKVWKTLRDFGCRVYLVAPDIQTIEGSKVFADLHSLKDKVDVVVPCLRPEYLGEFIAEAAAINVKYIWFQEKNWTAEFAAQCEQKNLGVIRGCVLKHKVYAKPLAFFHPCYWHGLKETKVPSKYQRF